MNYNDCRQISMEEWITYNKPKERGQRENVTRTLLDNIIAKPIDEGKKACYVIKAQSVREIMEDIIAFSRITKGQFHTGKYHFVHNRGRAGSVTYICHNRWEEFSEIRKVTQLIVNGDEVGWAPQQCSRTIDDWLGFNEIHPTKLQVKRILPKYQFLQYTPCQLDFAYEFDMKHAYWQIAERVPSPLVTFGAGTKLYHRRCTKQELDRWHTVMTKVAPYKSARHAIVGAWVGGYCLSDWKYATSKFIIQDGERVPRPGQRPSRLGPLGLLIVRCCYEMCQEEWLRDNGVYAWVDCIRTASPTPTYWEEMGITWHLKEKGPLHQFTATDYRFNLSCHGRYTTYYHLGEKFYAKHGYRPTHRSGLPGILLPRDSYYHPRLLQRTVQ